MENKVKDESLVERSPLGDVASWAKDKLDQAGDFVTTKIDLTVILKNALKVPGVKIDRSKYLEKELKKYCSDNTVKLAIENNPAYAGISRKIIDKIAVDSINIETKYVTTISAGVSVAGIGGMGTAITVDLLQYFAYMLRAMQKLIYLYGFPEINIADYDSIDDETMNEIVIFMGVMFGVSGASATMTRIADQMAAVVSKRLAAKALTKGTIYPIVKKIVTSVGLRMTKQIFADGVANTIPVFSAGLSGGLTYVTFKPCCNRLKKKLSEMNLSDPDFYHRPIINEE